MFGQAGIPRGKENLWNRPRTIQKDPTKDGNSPFCRASPIAFRKRGRDTSGEALEALRDVFQGRPELFLSYEEYKVLVGTPKTAETFYTFVLLRNFPRQLRELCRLQYHYFLAFGYVQDIVDMRVYTRGQTGFAAFERLLVEDYELFPPEYRKNGKSAPAGVCRYGSKTHGKVCILEGTAGSVSGGMDLPTCSAEQETGEAIVSEEWQHPEAGGTQEGQESIVPEERQQPEAGGTQEGQEAIVSEERQHPEAGGTQQDKEANVSEERQQPEAGGTQEDQEANVSEERHHPEADGTQQDQEANVSEERHHPEAGGTQEKRWELPKKLLANKAVWNIQNKDDDCFY